MCVKLAFEGMRTVHVPVREEELPFKSIGCVHGPVRHCFFDSCCSYELSYVHLLTLVSANREVEPPQQIVVTSGKMKMLKGKKPQKTRVRRGVLRLLEIKTLCLYIFFCVI